MAMNYFTLELDAKAINNTEQSTDQLKCQYVDCGKAEEDSLIKCNACDVWVCEGCHNVPISKLKQVMNKCKTVFFSCKACNSKVLQLSGNSSPTESINENPNSVINTSDSNLFQSIERMFEQHVSSLENKMESLFDDKRQEKGQADILNESVKGAKSGNEPEKMTYARILRVPEEVRKVINETKNNERVEESEIEKRVKNLIIHGAEEYGRNMKEIQEADNDYVMDILDHLGTSQKPVKILRLGKQNERKMRPIKLIMSSKEAKDNVMQNLRKLRDTEDYFGKISVTEDYTQTEREMIREWNAKAKSKSENDADYNYKVRGNPKNGLSLKRYAKS